MSKDLEFERLLKRWRSVLVGASSLSFEPSAPIWRSKIEQVTRTAHNYALSMQPDGAEMLWLDVPKLTNAGDIRECYYRLQQMAVALHTKGSPLYQDPSLERSIIQGLAWVYAKRYNEQVTPYGNWWHWEIGAPLPLLNTMGLLWERLADDTVAAYLRTIDRFVPNPETMRNSLLAQPYASTGANRVWKSRAYLFRSLLDREAGGIKMAVDALSPVFDVTLAGDGFYEDGSFIQHKKHPYTGGYGKSLLKELAELTYVLHGTPWELHPDKVNVMIGWIERSFDPLLYKGQMMDMVRGREISRRYPDSHLAGQAVIGAALQLAEVAAPDPSAWLKGKAKQWILSHPKRSFEEDAPIPISVLARKTLQDGAVKPLEESTCCQVFPHMDRAVARGPGYAFGISMFSERTGSYESINGENLRGWYTAHGMTYVYNADLNQYSDGFWPTVDPYRLPGTTVSKVPRSTGFGHGREKSGAFVGGAVCEGRYGLVGMELDESSEFRARKSWFLFGDVLVALGTVLEGSKVSMIETIIENRMLDRQGSNTILVEEEGSYSVFADVGIEKTLRTRSIHLSGHVPGSDIGYVFPRSKSVRLLREERSGRWSDIDTKGVSEPLKRHYFTAWFEHDAQGKDDEYAYLLLPGRTPRQIAAFEADPIIEIVACTREMHAVMDKKLGLYAVHFWEDRQQTTGRVRSDKRASVLVKEDEGRVEVCIADPSQSHEGTMTLELDVSVQGVEACDERITVNQLSPFVGLSVNLEGVEGSTIRIVFRKSLEQDLIH